MRRKYEPLLHSGRILCCQSLRERYRGDVFCGSLFAAVCCLPCRSFQGDLPSGSRIYLLALCCAGFSRTPGGRWCAEHRSVMGGAESHLPSASILPPFTAAAFRATTPQLPTDATSTPIPWISWDTTSTPTPSDSTAASPSLSASQRNTWTVGRWE